MINWNEFDFSMRFVKCRRLYLKKIRDKIVEMYWILVKCITRDRSSSSQKFFEIGFQACSFIKKRLQHRYFLWNLRNFLQSTSSGCFCKDQLSFENNKTWTMGDKLESWFFLYYEKYTISSFLIEDYVCSHLVVFYKFYK